jgi:hypothetical protein
MNTNRSTKMKIKNRGTLIVGPSDEGGLAGSRRK